MSRAVVVSVACLTAGAILSATALGRHAATTTVTVSGKEFSFALKPKTAPAGTVVFRFTNKGQVPHDFKITGRKTPLLVAGKSAKLTVKLKRGRYPFLCTVPGHAAAGMKGVFVVK